MSKRELKDQRVEWGELEPSRVDIDRAKKRKIGHFMFFDIVSAYEITNTLYLYIILRALFTFYLHIYIYLRGDTERALRARRRMTTTTHLVSA